MHFPPIETLKKLRAALPTMSSEQLIAEAGNVFSYYGNAVHNAQPKRVDDAIERFKAVKAELARRLGA